MKSIVLVLFLIFASNLYAQNSIIGTWITQKKDAKIQIYESNGKYFGKIVWIKHPLDENKQPQKDIKNPDEKLRNQELVGLNILTNFIFEGDNSWTDGKIYDPNNGKTYSCNMKLKDGKLEIRGYVGIPLFGRTEIWERSE